MARKTITDMTAWPSLNLEGNLIAPAMVAQIYAYGAPEQSEEQYKIRKGLTIREEISTAFRVGQSHFDSFAKIANPSAEATKRFAKGFLEQTFGFDDLTAGESIAAFISGGRIPIVVVPPSEEKLDRRSPSLSSDRSRSAAFALQDYLNDHDDTLWGLVTNGTQLRLMRDNASLTRPAYIEADLKQIFQNEDVASFAVLWLLIHRSRFGIPGAPATDCPLERWRDAGSKEGAAARDKLAIQVEKSLKLLGSGFLEANPELAQRLKSGEVNLTEWFNELLRLVYRLIFLMVAEDRNLLHPEKAPTEARKLYGEGYSLAQLRAQCFRAASWDKHHDKYEAVKIVFRALAHGQTALALPALGGLFAEDRLPQLNTARLRNRAFMEALYHLSWLADGTGMVPVNWRAMETEELGSVYESLLELQPQLGDDGKTLLFATEAAEQRGNQRKTTGSYYTPDSLVQALLDTALDPVLDKTEAEADDPTEALLKLTVIDPACGSGHFLLAAARRIATRLARIRAEGTPAVADFRHALRDVARCCIHGVDRNPMAVELTKVALWIETVDPGLPLGFFDAQIRCGDALLGVFDLKALEIGIPDAAYKPLTGDDKETAKHFAARNRNEKLGQGTLDFTGGGGALPAARQFADLGGKLRALREDTLEDIAAKARQYQSLRSGPAWYGWKVACDAYVAAFLTPKTGGVPANRNTVTVPTTAHIWDAMAGRMPYPPLVGRVVELAETARAFHWPLEFPDVMLRGGFDVVLGNPPWERIKLQEQEFFAARSPDIAAAPNKAARDRLIKALAAASEGSSERALHTAFIVAKREAEAASEFARVPAEEEVADRRGVTRKITMGGRFALTGRGDVNTYALFAELFANLARQRAGIIVPTGIATDATTAPFFAHLVEEKRLARLVDFENRAGLFPAVDSRMKFSLLTLGRNEPAAHFAFFISNVAQLAEAERNFTLSPAEIATINPNTKTAPVFRSRADAELTAKIYRRIPIFFYEHKGSEGNPWRANFYTRIWHMAEDSEWFSMATDLTGANLTFFDGQWQTQTKNPSDESRFSPLYEAKMIHQYDHRWATYNSDGSKSRDSSLDEKCDHNFEPVPRYWVPETEVIRRLVAKGWQRGWIVGWRKITRSTDERTLISSVLPRGAAGDSLPLVLPDLDARLVSGLIGNFSSLILDFVERQKLGGTNLTFQFLFQLPILNPHFYTETHLAFITPKVLELTYTSHSLAPFARDLGYEGPPFNWDEDRRAQLRADLDAFYARAYGLTRDELRYILDPADVMGPDYPSETFRVLKEKEIRQHGEYRTRRLVLSAWDRMEADGTFRDLGLM
jgi:hypothetical protein